MQSEQLIKYLKHPNTISKESLPELKRLVEEFPYFQTAHLLYSIATKKWDASAYQQSLKKTAISVSNRVHLFKLIHAAEEQEWSNSLPLVLKSDEEKQKLEHEEIKEELEILKAAELSTEIPVIEKLGGVLVPESDVLEKEIQKQVVVSFVEKELLKTNEVNVTTKKVEQPESFGDWLAFLKKNNGKETYKQIEAHVNKTKAKKNQGDQGNNLDEVKQVELRKQKNKAIMDKVIEQNPGHIKIKEEQKFFIPEIKAKESLLENEHLITETLARIYALQGNVNKAVRAYEILSLKFPQKSAYFASLIQKLKNNIE